MQNNVFNSQHKHPRTRLLICTCTAAAILILLPVRLYASALICLDFNGHTIDQFIHYGESHIPAYDFDNNPQVLSEQEALEIRNITAIVREDFSPFDIDIALDAPLGLGVDAVYPACPESIAKGQGVRAIIGGSAEDISSTLSVAGIAVFGAFNSIKPDIPNIAIAFAQNPASSNRPQRRTVRQIADTVSHEVGHTMLLSHAALYDNGSYNCYIGPGTAKTEPVMGGRPKLQKSVLSERTIWGNEQVEPLLGAGFILEKDDEKACEQLQNAPPGFWQNDMDILASVNTADLPPELQCTAPSSQTGCTPFQPNGFGYRQDDHSNSTRNASRMAAMGNGRYEQTGIIERTNDVDFFRFIIPTSLRSELTVSAVVRVGRMFPEDHSDKLRRTSPNLNAHLTLLDSSGTHVITQNGKTGRDGLDARISAKLPAGEYTLAVRSHGEPGDAGRYSLELGMRDGLSIVSALPMPDRLRVEFSSSIDLATLRPIDVRIMDGLGNIFPIAQNDIRPIENSLRHFDILFTPYRFERGVKIAIGPDITTANGIPMDQSGDGPIGQTPQDEYSFEDFVAPEVTGIRMLPLGFNVSFSEPVQASSFHASHVWLRGPGGLPISPLHGEPQATSATQFFVPMLNYPEGGVTIVINGGIRDWFGNESVAFFNTPIVDDGGPQVIQATAQSTMQPAGGVAQLDTVLLGFSEMMSPNSLSVDSGKIRIAYLGNVPATGIPTSAGPQAGWSGTPVVLRDIALYQAPGLGQNHPQFGKNYKVAFTPIGFGLYALVVDPSTTDIFGNHMDQDDDGLNGEYIADTFRYEFEISPLLQP